MTIPIKGAVIGGVINATINGVSQWFKVKDQATLLLTDDRISSKIDTVFSGAVPQALISAFILTAVVYLISKIPNKPAYFPKIFFMSMRHAIFAFGAILIVAILVQRFLGSIYISPLESALIIGIISGLVSGTINYLTTREIMP